MASLNQSKVALTDLLPTSAYDFAYSLPLLFTSLILAFAGAFLTLDRSRSFAPRAATLQIPGLSSFDLKRRKRPRFYLEGGIGGLFTGWAFGLHLSTFLTLVVPNVTTSAPLSRQAFLAVWILSALPTAILAGRFKYITLGLSGITGGTSLALALAVSIHPSLLTRRILLALLVSVLTLLTLVPIQRTQHASIRLAASATGTFGLILAAALCAHVAPWANVWERLWLSDGVGWATGSEHALSAGFWLILSVGCLSDWALRRYLGGNPDEKWDSYLADYTASLPLAPDRAGTFQPVHTTFLDRFFPWFHRRPTPAPEVLFPLADDLKLPASPRASLGSHAFPAEKTPFSAAPFTYNEAPRMLRKASQRPFARFRSMADGQPKREPVKFGQLRTEDLSSDSEDDEMTLRNSLSTPPPPRRLSTRSSASKPLTNGSDSGSSSRAADMSMEDEKAKVSAAKRKALQNPDGVLDYSDYEEEDVTANAPRTEPWRPPFLAGRRSEVSLGAPAGAVPLTPSLMRALDRVAVAQVQALGAPTVGMPVPSIGGAPVHPVMSSPLGEEYGVQRAKGERWEDFWRDVKQKAGEGLRK